VRRVSSVFYDVIVPIGAVLGIVGFALAIWFAVQQNRTTERNLHAAQVTHCQSAIQGRTRVLGIIDALVDIDAEDGSVAPTTYEFRDKVRAEFAHLPECELIHVNDQLPPERKP
jgi:hypothetical protein